MATCELLQDKTLQLCLNHTSPSVLGKTSVITKRWDMVKGLMQSLCELSYLNWGNDTQPCPQGHRVHGTQTLEPR